MSSKKVLSIITAAGLAGTSIQPISAFSNRRNESNNELINSRLGQTDNNLSRDNRLDFNEIDLFGDSNGYLFRAANIRFNKSTKKLEVISESDRNISSSKANNSYVISLYNSNGNIIKTETYKSSDSAYDIVKDFNGISFNYGDSINIKSNDLNVWTRGVDLKDNYPIHGNGPSVNISYEITENGLIKQENKLTINPIKISEGKIHISGKAEPNSLVNIWINNNNYIVMSDSKGLYNLSLSDTDEINKISNVIVFNKGNAVVNSKVKSSLSKNTNNTYLNKIDTISIFGSWGVTYLVSNINFNYSNNKIEISNPGFREFSKKADSLAYIITLYNKNGDVIKSVQYKGKNTNIELHKDFNGLDFNYGDYIRIQSYGLNLEIGNLKDKSKSKINGLDNPDLLCEITKEGLKEVILPSVKGLDKSEISLDKAHSFSKEKAYNDKLYSHKTNSKDNSNKGLPLELESNIPVIISEDNLYETTTLPFNYFFNEIAESKELIFNIHKKTSMIKNIDSDIKDNNYTLKSYEPLGVQIISEGKISIQISGDIKGNARLYINNGSLIDIDKIIPVNEVVVVDLSETGILILDTKNIYLEDEDDDIPFNFSVKVDMMNIEYRQIPVLDNRENLKLCDYAINDSKLFYNDVNDLDNMDYGALIITENIRICIPYMSDVRKNLNIDKLISNYNKIFLEIYEEEYFSDFLYITYSPDLGQADLNKNDEIEPEKVSDIIDSNKVESNEKKIITYTIKVEVIDVQTNTALYISSATGEVGELTGLKSPEIPEGYHLVNITNKDGQILTGVPYKFTNSDESIIYNITKNLSKIILKISDGKNLRRKVYLGAAGAEFIPDNLKIPKDYYLIGPDRIPTTFGEKDQNLIYNMLPKPKNKIIASIITVSGEVLMEEDVIAEGIVGSDINIEKPKIPENYHLVKVLLNDKEVSKIQYNQIAYTVPAKILLNDTKISYIVANNIILNDPNYRRMISEYSREEDIDNKVIEPINNDYIYENNTVSHNEYKNGEVIIRIVDQKGNVLDEAIYHGEIGLRVKPMDIPNEYKLVNISLNGNTALEEDIKYEIQENLETENKITIIYNVDFINR